MTTIDTRVGAVAVAPTLGPGRRERRPGRVHATHRWPITPWLFVLPALGVLVLFIVLPFLSTIRLAFTDSTLLQPGSFVGLENFDRLLGDSQFRTAIFNSTLYMVVVVPFMMFLPLGLAALVAGGGRFLGFFRTTSYLPVIMSPVIVGLIWTNLLDDKGMINNLLSGLSFTTEVIPFLSDRWLLLFSAMFVTVWTGMGYYMVIFLAAIANIDRSLYEAAAIDGAGPIRSFLHITIPGVRSTIALIGLLSSVAAFRVFSEVYVLTGGTGGVGGQDITLTMLIQREGTGLQAQTGYASAISLVMFVVLGTLLVVQLTVQQRRTRSS